MSLGLRNSCEVSKDRSSAGAVGGEEGNGQFSFSHPRDSGGKKKKDKEEEERFRGLGGVDTSA